MEKTDVQALAAKMIGAVKAHVAEALAPLVARIEEFDERLKALPPPQKGDKGDPGPEPDLDPLRRAITAEIAHLFETLPRPKDGEPGKDADPVDVEAIVARVVALVPAPEPGKDGQSVDPLVVRAQVAYDVKQAVAAIPAARDGEDGDPGRDAAELDILPSIDEAKSYRRGTWASHNGGLIRAARQTEAVQDGALLEAGWVVMVEGLAAVVVTQGEDPRALEVTCALTSGVKVAAPFRMPAMIYREVWREGEYEQGDVVTWAGSAWHCQEKTTEQPGAGPTAWKLMVKKGAPGKDGGGEGGAAPAAVVRVK